MGKVAPILRLPLICLPLILLPLRRCTRPISPILSIFPLRIGAAFCWKLFLICISLALHVGLPPLSRVAIHRSSSIEECLNRWCQPRHHRCRGARARPTTDGAVDGHWPEVIGRAATGLPPWARRFTTCGIPRFLRLLPNPPPSLSRLATPLCLVPALARGVRHIRHTSTARTAIVEHATTDGSFGCPLYRTIDTSIVFLRDPLGHQLHDQNKSRTRM
mmetsp:Transcript_44601/g.83079  ORF Transcript_44601/g.83079 Transcript_44601/m.83079 type:complete len:218 (+) Transcript_44601:2362-3015(+)